MLGVGLVDMKIGIEILTASLFAFELSILIGLVPMIPRTVSVEFTQNTWGTYALISALQYLIRLMC